MFDPEEFANAQVNDANATKLDPVPEGEYTGTITGFRMRELDSGQVVMDVTWELDDEALKEKLGRDRLTVRQGVFLDVENGKLATGPNKNVQLGKLREAVGQNKAGKPWAPSHLEGATAKVLVTHRQDKNDPTIVYDQVSRVNPLK